MKLNDCQSAMLSGVETKILRTDPVGIQGYDLIMSKDEAPIITKAIIDAGREHNFTTISASTLDFIRIENRIPLHNKELTENHNPLEANLQASISDNKGCYVGQEVIARINTLRKTKFCCISGSASFTVFWSLTDLEYPLDRRLRIFVSCYGPSWVFDCPRSEPAC